MARAARGLGGELRGQIDRAADGGRWSLAVVAVLAVGREGLETALFLWAATQAGTRDAPAPVADLAAAARRRPRPRDRRRAGLPALPRRDPINLSRFFTWTGGFLILVAAGVLSYGVHDLQEAGILPGPEHPRLRRLGHDRPGHLVRHAAQGRLQLLARTTGSRPSPGCSTLVPTMTLFVLGVRRRAAPRAAATPSPAPAPAPAAR